MSPKWWIVRAVPGGTEIIVILNSWIEDNGKSEEIPLTSCWYSSIQKEYTVLKTIKWLGIWLLTVEIV